jgi:LysR family nod box-dependent transcriptional activator
MGRGWIFNSYLRIERLRKTNTTEVLMSIRFHQLDLNLLVALDALLTERSITGAAKRLHLSQSATSGILARLREFFDDDLLVQVGRKMMPSPLAMDLIGRVRHVLHTVNSTIVTRNAFDPLTSHRHFRIGASDFVKTVLMTHAVRIVARDAPSVTMEFCSVSDDPVEQIEQGDLDLAILPEYLLGGVHSTLTLFESRHTCLIWAGNHSVKESLTFKQYMEMGHVVIRFGRKQAPGFEDWFIKRYGHARRIEVISDDFNSIPQLIEGTQRIATIHERLAAFYAQYLDLRLLEPPIDIPPVKMCLQWHRYLDADPGHRWMRQLILSVANGGGSPQEETERAAATHAPRPARKS